MRTSFYRGGLPVVLLGVAAGLAQAAQLSMRFADGSDQVTLAPTETAIIEIVWRMNARTKTARDLAGLSNRFNVTGPASIVVVSVSTALPEWDTLVSSPAGTALSDFFAAVNTDTSFITETDVAFETVMQEIEIRNVDGTAGTVTISFHVEEPNPNAFTSAPVFWLLVAANPGPVQYDIGQGSPGYEAADGTNVADPLVIHLVSDGGGGQGGNGNANTNVNENTAGGNDNTTGGDNANENTAPNQNDNVNSGNDNANAGNENANTGGDENANTGNDNVNADNENANTGGDGGDSVSNHNDNRRPGGGGGGTRSSGPCGIGMLGFMLSSLAGLLLMRIQRRR
jgi:hypothetical protein